MRSGNPALSSKAFENSMFRIETSAADVMTVGGAVTKTGILLAFVVAGAAISWHQTVQNPQLAYGLAMVGVIAGLVLALITMFKPTASPYTAPVYAACEGLFLGAISAIFNAKFPGIVVQAVGLTFGVMGAMLLAYGTGIIKATERFKAIVTSATLGIALFYLVAIVLRLFGVDVPLIHQATPWGIGFSLFVVAIASLNLVLDFDQIAQNAQMGVPKYMEWYSAFTLLVTLVWLYIEILRLLAKLRSQD